MTPHSAEIKPLPKEEVEAMKKALEEETKETGEQEKEEEEE
jgi:aromatic ring-opening dioxygenase LigB subunit